MAVRDADALLWVQTRKTLAMTAIDTAEPRQAALLHNATAEFFNQAEVGCGRIYRPRRARNPASRPALTRLKDGAALFSDMVRYTPNWG